MAYNLEELMKSLETDMEKSASEKSAPAPTQVPSSFSDDLANILTKKASLDVMTQARLEGEALALKFIEKVANEINVDNAVMQAQADAAESPNPEGTAEQIEDQIIDKALASGSQPADQIKTASENGEQPVNTIMNKIQEDNAVMDAQADAKVQPLPGEGGTANQIVQAIVAKAQAEGSAEGLLDSNEGAAVAASTAQTDEVEKVAAVSALVEAGFDFDSAVDLVKQAEEELNVEAWEQEKQAAMAELMEAGIDFDDAVTLVKQAEEDLEKKASAGEVARGFVSPAWMEHNIAKKHGKEGPKGVWNNLRTHLVGTLRSGGRSALEGVGAGAVSTGAAVGIAKLLKKDPSLAASAAGALGYYTGAVHGSIKSLSNQAKEMKQKYSGQEKKAALDELLASGVNFDEAVELIKEAGLPVIAKNALTATANGVKKGLSNKAKLGIAAGGVAAVGGIAGGIAASRNREKQAAFEALANAGVDFDTAIELIKQAEQEVYGDE